MSVTNAQQLTDRRCIFCGAPARSREHAFPHWLNSVLLDPNAGPSVAERFGIADGTQTLKTWTTDQAAKQTVRMVCHNCNTGWMSALEANAKPLLTPMIKGQQQTLDGPAQLLVATWTVKSFMVLDEVLGSTHPFAESSRAFLRKEERPPEDAWVFISGINSSIGPLRFTHAAARTQQQGGGVAHFDVYTGQIGALVLQCVVTDIPVSAADRWGLERLPDFPSELERLDFEIEIFPPRRDSIRWPSSELLDDRMFVRYVQRMRGNDESPFPKESRFPAG